jgi:hypothetical protein
MELHAKVKGALGEAKVAGQLIGKGYPVFTEFGDNSKVDLIALVDRQPVKVLRTTKSGPGYRFTYDENDFDVMAVYIIDEDVICYVSSKKLFESGYLILRTRPTKNNQQKGCNFVENFLEFEDVLRDYTPNTLTG